VPPPRFPDSQDDPTWERYKPPALNAGDNFVNGFGQAGMRVPTAVLSPWHTGGVVDHGVYDHVSILKFIGESFGLPVRTLNPLRVDATLSIEASFDFNRPKNLDVEVQTYDAPHEVRTEPHLEQVAVDPNPLFELQALGWAEELGHRTDHRIEDSYRRSRAPIAR
jgi:phospholipase C